MCQVIHGFANYLFENHLTERSTEVLHMEVIQETIMIHHLEAESLTHNNIWTS